MDFDLTKVASLPTSLPPFFQRFPSVTHELFSCLFIHESKLQDYWCLYHQAHIQQRSTCQHLQSRLVVARESWLWTTREWMVIPTLLVNKLWSLTRRENKFYSTHFTSLVRASKSMCRTKSPTAFLHQVKWHIFTTYKPETSFSLFIVEIGGKQYRGEGSIGGSPQKPELSEPLSHLSKPNIWTI